MIKKLTKHGNSLALVVDRAVLDLLKIDADTPLDDELNLGAPGFEPFAGAAEGGKLDADMAALRARMSTDDYKILVDTLLTLGHVGEGHCHCGAH